MNKMRPIPIMTTAIFCLLLGCGQAPVATPSEASPGIVSSKETDSIESENLRNALSFAEEGLNKGSMEAFDKYVDSNVIVQTGLKPSGPINGREEYKTIFKTFLDAWPQVDFTVEESFATGDKVVIRFNSINAFKGEYYGMKPTNQVASLKEVHLMTFKGGKLINNIVSATNLEYEYILYPLLKDGVLKQVKTAKE